MLFNQSLIVAAQKSVDGKKFKEVNGKHVPYSSTDEILNSASDYYIQPTRRHEGQEFKVGDETWHFVGGITNENLVKIVSGGVGGTPGPKGDKGDTGPQGIQGVQGNDGMQGAAGPQGAQGLKGDKGDTGIQGVKGDAGSPGADGVSAIDDSVPSLTKVFSSQKTQSGLDAKVDKVAGKQLSTENYTTAEKSKLASITAIFTTALKTAYDNAAGWITTNGTSLIAHLTRTDNPHNVTKAQIGLGSVQDGAQVNDANTTLQGNTFNGALKLVKLDANAKLPAIDGSQLLNLPSSGGGAWGTITGDINSQSDLKAALDTLQEQISANAGNDLFNYYNF